MFDLWNHIDYRDYDKWLSTFAEASARFDAFGTAIADVRRLVRDSEGVHSAEVLEVLERHGV
jgi:hypothetical protein